MNGWTAKDMPDQTGRVVVITGANSGIGYESAVAFARKRAQVIMACRNPDKAERARQELLSRVPGALVEIMLLDLGNLKSVHAFAESFNTHYERLDVLMNNAGVMWLDYVKTPDGFETQFGTNHLGHFALTGLLLPSLLKTPHSRIVTVSSGAYLSGRINFEDLQGEKHYDRADAYAQSKLANILFTQELQRKLETIHADVISVAIHPGFAVTNLQNGAGNRGQQFMINLLKPIASQPAEPGATYQLYAATAPTVRGGEFYGPRWLVVGKVVRLALNARGKDTALAARLWQVSEQLTGVSYAILGKSALAYA
jgi:protochlorophyllide reductase